MQKEERALQKEVLMSFEERQTKDSNDLKRMQMVQSARTRLGSFQYGEILCRKMLMLKFCFVI